MKEFYDDISSFDTKQTLIQKFLELLTDDGVKLIDYQSSYVFLHQLYNERMMYFSSGEKHAIEAKTLQHDEECTCDLDTDEDEDGSDLEHDECARNEFDFDQSVAYRFYHEEVVHTLRDSEEARFIAWQAYKKYFYVWQRFCIPRLTELQREVIVCESLYNILPADLEKLCLSYLTRQVQFVGPFAFKVSNKKSEKKYFNKILGRFAIRGKSKYSAIVKKMENLVPDDIYEILAKSQRRNHFRILCTLGYLEAAKLYHSVSSQTESTILCQIFKRCVMHKHLDVAHWLYSTFSNRLSQDVGNL